LSMFLLALAICAPELAMAQASPFMTGASSLQTNARVAREYLIALPVELSPQHRIGLAREFSQELSDRYRFAVDVAVHAARNFPGSDPRNFHAHLLATTREVTTQGLGAKTTLEWNDGHRREVGLSPAINELLHVRERWGVIANEALHAAQIDARIDHRTLAMQGIDREPRPYIPKAAFEMERHGFRSTVAERMRADYQARLEMREGKSKEVEPTLDEIQRKARESWLELRERTANAAAEPKVLSAEDDLAR
jgi:MobA/MobL family